MAVWASNWASRCNRRSLGGVGFAGACALAGVFAACGGSTGREGLPQPATSPIDGGTDATDATVADGEAGSLDATVEATLSGPDAGFEANIEYADASRLPEVGTVSGGDAAAVEGGPRPIWEAWPVCNPDPLAPDPTGIVEPRYCSDCTFPGGADSGTFSEVPDPSGACSTYQWLKTFADAGETCDHCLRRNVCGLGLNGGVATFTGGTLPPCSDLREAGTAAQGPGRGRPLFELCAELFECVERTGCMMDGPPPSFQPILAGNCYCGPIQGAECKMPGAARGACKAQIEAAYQSPPLSTLTDNITNIGGGFKSPLYAGVDAMRIFSCAWPLCKMCFPPPKDPLDAGGGGQ